MKKIKYTSSFFWFLLILMVWGNNPILGYVYAVFYKLPVLNTFAPYIVQSLYVIVILASAKYWGNRLSHHDVSIFALFILIAIFSLILYPSNSIYIEKIAVGFIFMTIPYYLLGSHLNIEECEKYFYWISIVSILLQAAYLLLYGGRSEFADSGDVAMEDMPLSYQLLPHTLMVIWQTLKQPSYKKIPVSLLAVFLHLSLGTRGPVVCVASFSILYMLFVKWKASKTTSIIIGFLAALMMVFSQPLFFLLNMLIIRAGLSTRIFDFMENEELNNMTGRDDISWNLLLKMDTAPVFGYGLGGDRQISGYYAHNFFLEMIVSFGWVLGIILIIVTLLFFARAYIYAKNEVEKGFLLVLFCCGFVKLMMSGTFLNEPYFFLLLGFCSCVISRKRFEPVLVR